MDLEKLATSAVMTALSKTDRLSGFINSGDKEPCWDGNIYIHEEKNHSKKNIKKVATQVKGKAVKAGAAKDTVKFPVSHDDLNAYMMNGGTMFFVVHLDNITGDVVQIYYAALLPVKIKELLKETKTKYQIICRKFPDDILQKTELLLNFYDNAQRQASFAGKDLPSIEDLTKQGILESLTFHYTGIGKELSHFSIPKELDGKALTLYANVKGGTIPVPVEYFDCIRRITTSSGVNDPICVNGQMFYHGYTIVTTAEKIALHIGSCVTIVFPNIDDPSTTVTTSVKIHIHGTLENRIKGMEFIIAMKEHGSFTLMGRDFQMSFSDTFLSDSRIHEYRNVLEGYRKAQKLLKAMHVKTQLDLDSCSEDDLSKLNLLIGTIGEGLPTRRKPEIESKMQIITIANLKLAVVFIPKGNGEYTVYDYFCNHFFVEWRDDDKDPVRISQFSTLVADDFLSLDNLNLPFILDDYQTIPQSTWLFELANTTMLEMLEAYDKSPSTQLLSTAKQMSIWLTSFPEYTTSEVTTINELQIVLRERPLTFSEKSRLHSIIAVTQDSFYKIGAFLLLDEHAEAQKLLDTLTSEELSKFSSFPIYQRFHRTSVMNTDAEGG